MTVAERDVAGTEADRKLIDRDFVLGATILTSLFVSLGFGAAAILVFLIACILLLIYNIPKVTVGVLRGWPFMIFVCVALISTSWSQYPDLTLRAGVQLLLTMVVALGMANTLSPRQFIYALYTACLITVGVCLAIPRTHVGPEGIAFVGIMGSKNQMSFLAGLLISCAAFVVVDQRSRRLMRLTSAGAIVGGVGLLLAAKSVGGLIGAILSVAVFVSALILNRLSQTGRVVALVCALVLTTPVAVMTPTLTEAGKDFMITVLHKDPTLTGRTYLWDRSRELIAQRPMLGTGYHAFWVQGEPDAEGLWAYAKIKERLGFNFHNHYVDTLVVLGVVGLVALIILLATVFAGVALETILAPSAAGAFFLSFVVVQLARTPTETSLIAEFGFYTIIFCAAGVYGWAALRTYRANRPVFGGRRPFANVPAPSRAIRPPLLRPDRKRGSI